MSNKYERGQHDKEEKNLLEADLGSNVVPKHAKDLTFLSFNGVIAYAVLIRVTEEIQGNFLE